MIFMAYSPQVPDSGNIILGEGKIYKNYGLGGTEAIIGATRGGASFSVARDIKEIDFDGSYGAVKTLRRKTKIQPSLKVSMLELNYDNLVDMFCGLSTTPVSTYTEVTESIDIAEAEYFTNIAFVGTTLDGVAVVIVIDNALADEKIEMAFKTKDEVVADTVFTGHYDTSTPTTPPYSIRYYDIT
jgi:hypothetical protein